MSDVREAAGAEGKARAAAEERDARASGEARAPEKSLPPDLEVRPMAEADLDRVTDIEIRSFSVPWKRRTFRNLLGRDDAELWVAEVGEGSVIAYLVLWFASDEAELADVAVEPEFQGRGLGGLLVARAIERARDRGARSLFLEVRASNQRALELYRTRGFHVISVRKGYYTKPREDALVMLKSLW